MAAEAQGWPKVRDDAESLLALSPDLVIVSRYTAASTRRALTLAGVAWAIVTVQFDASV